MSAAYSIKQVISTIKKYRLLSGVGNAIMDYANLKHKKGVKIEFEVDFASFQPGDKYNTPVGRSKS